MYWTVKGTPQDLHSLTVNKDFKNRKTNRPKLDDLQNANLEDSSFKLIYCFKSCKCYFDCNATSKNTILKYLKHILEQVGIIFNNDYFLPDDTRLLYHNVIDMLLLTDKLKLKCYVLYETKELLTITKMHITIINILTFIISIAITIIIIIMIIFTITVITISIIIVFVKSAWRNVKSDNYLLQFLCHMTSNVKFLCMFLFIHLFFIQKLQHSMK